MVTFYKCFIPHAAQLMQPLYEALPGNWALDWSQDRAAEDALVQMVLLVHLFPDAPSALKMGASYYVVAAVCV